MLTRRLCIPVLAGLGMAGRSAITAPARAATGRLRVGGTGMALAAMRRVGAGFIERNPGAEIEVLPSLGTGGGLSAVGAGVIDLALSARPLDDGERARGLHAVAYARTPVAFVTHPRTAATGVALEEVARILRGEMTTWPDGAPLRLVRREPSDADWTMLRRLSPEMGGAVEVALKRHGLLTVATDQDNADALDRLRGSFGAMAVGQLRAEALDLKPLLLDGVAPEPANLADGRYPMSRTLHAAWNREATPLLAGFLLHLRGPEGQAVLAGLGHDAPADAA